MLDPAKDIFTVTGLRALITKIVGGLATKVAKTDVVSSWQSTPDDAHVPTEKLVKDTLDNLPPGTAVKGDAESEYRTGNVNLTPANIGAYSKTESDSRYKAVQNPVSDPAASGSGLSFIDSVSQDANGVITPHKKTVQDGTTAQKGVVQLQDSVGSTESATDKAATPHAVRAAINSAVSSAYHAAGTKTVAQLTSSLLVAENEGCVYNVTDSGTTTSDFVDGAGHPINAGDNVGVCKVGNDYKFDLLSGFVDLSNHLTKTGDASNTTSTFTKESGDTSSMASGGKLSAIFTAISSFFASLKALAFKDKASYSDLSSGVQASLNKADTALQSSDVDSALSQTSTNPVQNKVITASLAEKTNLIFPASAYGYSLLFTVNFNDTTEKKGTVSFRVHTSITMASPVILVGRIGANNIRYQTMYYTVTGVNEDRFKLCYKKVGDNTEVWLIDKFIGAASDRKTVVEFITIQGAVTVGNNSTSTLPSDLIDFHPGYLKDINIDAALISSGAFGTDRIADDAITAAKVKDNETLPVNISGNAASATNLAPGGTSGQYLKSNGSGTAPSWENTSNLSVGSATKLVEIKKSVSANTYTAIAECYNSDSSTDYTFSGLIFSFTCRTRNLEDVKGLIVVSPYEWDTTEIKSKTIMLGARGYNNNGSVPEFIIVGNSNKRTVQLWALSPYNCVVVVSAVNLSGASFSSINSTSPTAPANSVESDLYCEVVAKTTNNNKSASKIGNTTLPVYVDTDGSVKPCNFTINFGTPIAGTNVLNIVT